MQIQYLKLTLKKNLIKNKEGYAHDRIHDKTAYMLTCYTTGLTYTVEEGRIVKHNVADTCSEFALCKWKYTHIINPNDITTL